jgi:PhzF family phenazine biosynthesis protein
VLPPTVGGADYRLRIFSPRGELPFAGHPTIGSAHAVLEAGVARTRDGVVRQECGAGVLAVGVNDGRLSVRVPGPRIARDAAIDAASVGRALGAACVDAPLAIDVGPVWLVGRLADAATVRALAPDLPAVERLSHALGATGITVFALAARGEAVVVRSFAPAAGVSEDPVCGSGNAAVGAYLAATGRLADAGERYRASQGRELGRDGVVHVHVAPDVPAVEIGGTAVTVIDGTLAL